jgi:hypothetical protein
MHVGIKTSCNNNGCGIDFEDRLYMPSTVIARFSYDPHSAVLRVVYVSGMVYDYLGVPENIYEEMKASFSKGTFLNLFIKGKYEFLRVE